MRRLDDLLTRISQIQRRAQQNATNSLPAAVAKLPSWPDPVRAVPNGFLRSALFGAIGKGKRRYVKGEAIAALEGIEIRYTGERLDQGDLDVWENLLHSARFEGLGMQCRVTSYTLLKLIGKTDTGKNRAILQTRIERLRANAVTMKQGHYTYVGGLIDEAYKDEETKEWIIVINPKLRILYAADQFTQLDWAVRRALTGKPLAQWLHGFYASHAKPYPILTKTLHKLCGSEGELPRFRQTLAEALYALAQACHACGQPFSYSIQNDLIHINKKASGSQRRHLAKKARKNLKA